MTQPALRLEEGRFARFESIRWWRQDLLRTAKVLVIGAGALGNEVIKNLALLGVGNLIIVDMDRIEKSNLCRSVLFREADEGKYKAHAAARMATELYGEINAKAIVANVLAEVGMGYFRWADVVVGALDNREARVFTNRACAMVGRPWIDGGIDVLNGIVRGFAPPKSACYECTMGQADWDLLAKRRSCALLARQAFDQGGAPTTPTTASIIGAIQAQEVIKRLHDLESLSGRGFLFEGLNHSSYVVDYPISPDCPWHSDPAPIYAVTEFTSDTSLRDIWRRAQGFLGDVVALDFSREIVENLECPQCHKRNTIRRPVELVKPSEAVCAGCGGQMVPSFCHSLTADSPLMELTLQQIGLPRWDIVWARNQEQSVGIECSGDRDGQ